LIFSDCPDEFYISYKNDARHQFDYTIELNKVLASDFILCFNASSTNKKTCIEYITIYFNDKLISSLKLLYLIHNISPKKMHTRHEYPIPFDGIINGNAIYNAKIRISISVLMYGKSCEHTIKYKTYDFAFKIPKELAYNYTIIEPKNIFNNIMDINISFNYIPKINIQYIIFYIDDILLVPFKLKKIIVEIDSIEYLNCAVDKLMIVPNTYCLSFSSTNVRQSYTTKILNIQNKNLKINFTCDQIDYYNHIHQYLTMYVYTEKVDIISPN